MGLIDKFRKKVGLPADRVVERGQGCWNCIHGSHAAAVDLWWHKAREATLARGLELATNSALGEKHPGVLAIRESVPQFDAGIENATWLVCKAGKSEADFTHSTYLCPNWSGQQGSSLATQGKTDLLPEEVLHRMGPTGNPSMKKPDDDEGVS